MRAVVVLPCYNEAKRLDVAAFRAYLQDKPAAELLFVDDGSTDGTRKILGDLATEFPAHASVLQLEKNSGKAEAVRHGFLEAFTHKPTHVGFWDADLATPLSCIGELLAVFADKPEKELVFGIRVQRMGAKITRRASRHYLGRVFATCVSLFLRMPIYDTQCGAKIFAVTPMLQEVFAKTFMTNWIFDVEILVRFRTRLTAKELEERMYEYPLPRWEDVPGSKLKATDFLRAPAELLRLWAHYERKDA